MTYPFPEDIAAIRTLLEQRAGLDRELVDATCENIEKAQYDDAVLKAFKVLEGRIQLRSGLEGEPASSTLSQTLGPKGALTLKMGLTSREAANLCNLLKAVFAVFRNPEAHPQESIIEYGPPECREILALVNLMLRILAREPVSPLDKALRVVQRSIGVEATRQLKRFLVHLRSLPLKVEVNPGSLSFRCQCLRQTESGGKAGKGYCTVFSLIPDESNPSLAFPFSSQWLQVAGFEPGPHVERLRALGCLESQWKDLRLYLRDIDHARVLARLTWGVQDIVGQMRSTLSSEAPGPSKPEPI